MPDIILSLSLTTRAARDIEEIVSRGADDTLFLDDHTLRDQATQSLLTLLEYGQRYLLYLRNGGQGRDGDQRIELKLATDVDHAPNAALTRVLGGRSLVLVGVEKTSGYYSRPSKFLLIRVWAIPFRAGTKDAWSQSAWIEFCADEESHGRTWGFPPLLLAAISRLPEASAQREVVRKRLSDWRRYLDILERMAKEGQFSVPYKAYRRGRSSKYITFILDSPADPTKIKIRSAQDQPVHVAEVPEYLGTEQVLAAYDGEDTGIDFEGQEWLVGAIEGYSGSNELKILLDEDVEEWLERGSFNIPRTGILRYKAVGDLAQVRRLQSGLDALERGRSENRYLSEFLFDAYQARLPDSSSRVTISRDKLLQPTLNDGQLAAVAGALNAPDLFLIQGPPGTGKTTVIAEICYQVAIRGGRTLVASQANLAVDHAMSRLVHHPSIRALRRGRAERVEEEGKPYLEDQVIATWLSRIADGCKHDLQIRRERIRMFQELLALKPRMEAFVEEACRYYETQPALQAQIDRFDKEIDDLRQQTDEVARATTSHRETLKFLKQVHSQLEVDPDRLVVEGPYSVAGDGSGPILDHPVLRQGEETLGALVAALGDLCPKLLESIWNAVDSANASSKLNKRLLGAVSGSQLCQTIIEYAQVASRALRASEEVRCQAENVRPQLDDFYQRAIGWYESHRLADSLLSQREQLTQEHLEIKSRVDELQGQLDQLEQRSRDLDRLQAELYQAHPAIQAWLEEVTAQTPAADRAKPLAGLSDPLGLEVWSLALGTVQISGLVSMASVLQTASEEARLLGRLVSRLDSILGRLTVESSPDYIMREERTGTNWRESSLRNLVVFDARGDFQLAPGADAALRRLDARLRASFRRPDSLSRLFGAERRRQGSIAHWVVLLSTVSADFSERQLELGERIKGLTLNLQQRYCRCARALEAAARREVPQLQQQTRERLTETHGQLVEAERMLASSSKQIAAMDVTMSKLGQAQSDLEMHLHKGLGLSNSLSPLVPLEQLAGQVERLSAHDWQRAWQTARAQFDAAFNRLASTSALVTPAVTIQVVADGVERETSRLGFEAAKLDEALRVAKNERDSATSALQLLEEQFTPEREWWSAAHEAIPEHLRPVMTDTNICAPAYLTELLSHSTIWDEELGNEQAHLRRIEGLVTDWIQRIESKDKRDEADLRQIYIDNANVIGITCVQAGSRRFSEQYRNFDYVIIDEVSKATPPELLLPMLKGAKIILVGDSRQLPPMIGPKALTDLAEELGVPKEEIEHIKRSLFRELFEKCPDDLRAWLTDQYRMHPQIMEAINQFYAERLVCAIQDPDRERAHGCEPLFASENHIAWIYTPLEKQFGEVRVGTSYRNGLELDIIERLVEQLDAVWQIVPGDKPRKQVGVITFYAAQARELWHRLLDRPKEKELKNLRIRVGTVDRFQGMERPIVIVSLVRNNHWGDIGFAKELERINVAFSRAQELLVIVGSRELFCDRAGSIQAATRYRRVADVVKRAGGLIDFSTLVAH